MDFDNYKTINRITVVQLEIARLKWTIFTCARVNRQGEDQIYKP